MRILPVIKVGHKLYFADERLEQYRSVVPFPEVIEFIEFGQQPWKKVEWICYHSNFSPDAGCPDCRFTEVIANNDPAPEAGVCMYNHDHNAEPDRCVWHD